MLSKLQSTVSIVTYNDLPAHDAQSISSRMRLPTFQKLSVKLEEWGLCEYVIVHTILPPSPVIL